MKFLRLVLFVIACANAFDVFFIPHSHCDAGWRNTFEGYYQSQVKLILTRLIDELAKNSTRMFNWAETGFLHRWWMDGDTARQQLFTEFVEQGRVSFAGGGWVQSDEATTTVKDVLNQLTEGHLWLQEKFPGRSPRIGWQIDPFGNAATTPIIFALCGFRGTVTDRVSIAKTLERISTGTMEIMWQPPPPYFQDPTTLQKTSILVHQLGLEMYQGDPLIFEKGGIAPVTPGNLFEKILEYDAATELRRSWYELSNPSFLLFPWGGDFKFENASQEFDNMDKILANVDNGKYATLDQYFSALFSLNLTWTATPRDDIPYDWPADSYWTGFYTSRAALKGQIRKLSSLVESADTFYVLSELQNSSIFGEVQNARRVLGILQHHDAITGTAKQFVVDDYFSMIETALQDSQDVLLKSVSSLCRVNLLENQPMNSVGKPFQIVVANTLSTSNVQYLQIPNLNFTNFKIVSAPYQFIGNDLYVSVVAPPLGYIVLDAVPTLDKSEEILRKKNVASTEDVPLGNSFFIENDKIRLNFDDNHMLQTWTNKSSGNVHKVSHRYKFYESERGSAYIMRVYGQAAVPVGNITTSVSRGPLVSIVTTTINNRLNHTWKLYQGADFAEIIYRVDSIEVPGYNLISEFSTEIENGNFYADESGWLIMDRRTNFFVESSYFPATEITFINDTTTSSQFSIITRQPHGVSSVTQGQLEINLFRRLANVGFPPLGLNEILNDMAFLEETQWVVFSEFSSEFPNLQQ